MELLFKTLICYFDFDKLIKKYLINKCNNGFQGLFLFHNLYSNKSITSSYRPIIYLFYLLG